MIPAPTHPDYPRAVRAHTDMDIESQGLVVFRASRLEALLQPLMHLLRALPPDEVLAPHIVIAAHPGMRQWLSRALAREAGPRGIAANLDIVLPSAWLDRLAQEVLGEAAVALAPYRREALRWRVFELLERSDDARVQTYLAGNDGARRRFQLADRIAALFSRYLVYRSDWLGAWAQGRDTFPEATLLAPLWREVRERIGAPHRGERLDALLRQVRKLPAGASSSQPVHVFGLSHLAPQELAVLRAVARTRPVVLYLPDPCRDYWAGLKPERARLRELARLTPQSDAAERAFLEELGHPLLASWGRQGQQFVIALAEADDEVIADIRDGRDLARSDRPVSLLDRLQESIRRLQPDLLRPADGAKPNEDDRSLRVHACHTRLRELEVLHDALLRAREDDPTILPSDIAVLAPGIQAYAPLIPAVFGAAGNLRVALPYHLADVALARGHALLAAFARVLDVPGSRLTAPQVLDLIAVPAVQRALGLDDDAVEQLGAWLAQARVAWALDGAAKRAFGVPANAEHSFAWGMDRLLAGYVLGQPDDASDAAQAHTLADGSVIVPLAGVAAPQAEALGALDRLLRELAALDQEARSPRTLGAWTMRLEQLVDALFRIDLRDDAESDALGVLRRLLRTLGHEAHDAGVDPAVDFDVVRELLHERLQAPAERQPFLLGGVTFCGMVPQRAIPFRVIAVLGLDDGAFPRSDSDGGIDLMTRHRRLGDRDVRSDDRWLFLETVMAARDALHLSYIGRGVRDDKPRNPAAPLAELLAALDDAHDLRGADDDVTRPWLLRHPLQPFDVRYFDGSDTQLFSYRADLAVLARPRGAPTAPFLEHAAAGVAVDAPLRDVLDYFKDPAKHLLRRRLNLHLDALEDSRLRESEPLEAGFERLDRVGQRLALAALERSEFELPAQPPAWLRHGGLWPPGAAGDTAWAEEREATNAVLARARREPLLAQGLPPRAGVEFDLDFDGVRVHGELSRLHRASDCAFVFALFTNSKKPEDKLDFRERIGLFLEWALAHLAMADAPQPLSFVLLTPNGATPWRDSLNRWSERLQAARAADDGATVARLLADLRARVGALLALWRRAQGDPRWYFPKTSWVAARRDGDADEIEKTWESDDNHVGERDYAPGYAQILARDARFGEDGEDRTQLVSIARQLDRLIRFDGNADGVPATPGTRLPADSAARDESADALAGNRA